jgi:drug/metabolite transporter (DMT)-like permease
MVIISAYCALSLVWSRIFLKEKLSWKHYLAIAIAFVGIIVLGIGEELWCAECGLNCICE